MRLTATFCFVDLAGYSALTEAHGDRAAADLVERFTTLVRGALGEDGRLVKTIGDAVLVTVGTPAEALRFLSRLCARVSEEPDFPVLRVGLHHGEAEERGGDVFGAAVNLAARLAAQAAGEQVLATLSVADVARGQGVAVTSLGSLHLHNLREPVEVFALDLGPNRPPVATDPVCRMRVDPAAAVGHLRVEGVEYFFCSLRCAALFAESPGSYRTRP